MNEPRTAGLHAAAHGSAAAWWLAAAVLVVYWPALLGSFVADDLRLLAHNPAVQAGDLDALLTRPMFGVDGGYWRPLLMLTLWLGNTIGGAFGVHLLALSLHVANALAVRALAERFVPARAAAWAALLFAVHPVQVESVAWCAAINDPLWVACTLQAMLATLRWRDRGARGLPWLAAALVFAAPCAKEPGIVVVPLAVAVVWRTPGAARWRAAAAVAAAGGAWLALRALVQHEWPGQVLVGAAAPVLTAPADFVRAAYLFVAQCTLLVWPWPQLLMRSVPEPAVAVAVTCTVALAAAVVTVFVLRRRLGPAVLLACALIAVPLLPVVAYTPAIGIYPIADRYAYLPVAGFALLLAHTLRVERIGVAAWLLPLLLAPFTFAATWTWHDSAHLVATNVRNAPNDAMVLAMAGDLALDRAFDGELAAVLEAEAYYGRSLAALGDAARGEQDRRTNATVRLGLAWCKLLRRTPGDAAADAAIVDAFRTAVEAGPDNAMTWVGLGRAHFELRQFDDAELAFTEALRVQADCAPARRGLDSVRAARAQRR